MVLVNVKVSEEVKSELDSLRIESESYNLIIKRVIEENRQLKADNERLFNIAENLSKKKVCKFISLQGSYFIMNAEEVDYSTIRIKNKIIYIN